MVFVLFSQQRTNCPGWGFRKLPGDVPGSRMLKVHFILSYSPSEMYTKCI